MTLIEMVIIVVFLLVAIKGALILGGHFGVTGVVVGFVAAPACLYGLFAGLMRIHERFWPIRPQCARGRCGPSDYQLVRLAANEVVFRCACGDAYTKVGDTFLRGEGNRCEPFTRWAGVSSGWVVDRDSNTPSAGGAAEQGDGADEVRAG
jgi:hypothetical protein